MKRFIPYLMAVLIGFGPLVGQAADRNKKSSSSRAKSTVSNPKKSSASKKSPAVQRSSSRTSNTKASTRSQVNKSQAPRPKAKVTKPASSRPKVQRAKAKPAPTARKKISKPTSTRSSNVKRSTPVTKRSKPTTQRSRVTPKASSSITKSSTSRTQIKRTQPSVTRSRSQSTNTRNSRTDRNVRTKTSRPKYYGPTKTERTETRRTEATRAKTKRSDRRQTNRSMDVRQRPNPDRSKTQADVSRLRKAQRSPNASQRPTSQKTGRRLEKLKRQRPEFDKKLKSSRRIYAGDRKAARRHYDESRHRVGPRDDRKHSKRRGYDAQHRTRHWKEKQHSSHHYKKSHHNNYRYAHRFPFDIYRYRRFHDWFDYHHYLGGWFIYPRHIYQRCRTKSFYFFIDLGGYEVRHVPYVVREYQVRYETEPVDVFTNGDWLSIAYQRFAQGRYDESVGAFDHAIRRQPFDGVLYFARAQALIAAGSHLRAYVDLMMGMDLIPDWPDIDLNIMELYGEPQDFVNHLRYLEEQVAANPTDYRLHFVLGYVYFFIQEYELSKMELVYTMSYSNEHHQALRLLEEIYEIEIEDDTIR